MVDDNPTNLKLVTDVLAWADYQVLQAMDAEQAVQTIKQSTPDLILMDIELPGMDGLTLTRKLKADDATRSICIVALTAFAMKSDQARALAAGCEAYITKPIDTRRLPEQIAQFIRQKVQS